MEINRDPLDLIRQVYERHRDRTITDDTFVSSSFGDKILFDLWQSIRINLEVEPKIGRPKGKKKNAGSGVGTADTRK